MSESSFNDEVHHTVSFLGGIIGAILMIHWGIVILEPVYDFGNDINNLINHSMNFIESFIFFFRLAFVMSIVAFFYLKKPRYVSGGSAIVLKRLINILIIICFLFGYSELKIYNQYVYPVLLFVTIYSIYTIFTTFVLRLKSENIFGISKEAPMKKLYYDYQTNQGVLRVHSGEQHIYVSGGTGAGKGDSIIHPTIFQHVQKDFPALIYDVKPELPLTKTAHHAFYLGKQEGKTFNSQLAIFNIANPGMSFRANMFSKRYLKQGDSRKLNEWLTSFLTNYNSEWRDKSKRDHWFKACLTVWSSLATRFLVDDSIRDKLSFPVLCELILTNRVGSVVNFILSHEDSARMFSQIRLSAMGNMKQFTGEFSSAMSGLSSVIMDKDLYWLLSADEINFDVNNPDDPTVLCLGGSEVAPETYTPFIATMISVVMDYFREKNKIPCLFELDEIYTIFLEHLPRDANKFRSNGVCMQIGNQLMTMLNDTYGKEKANNLFGACGSQFYGMGNDEITSGIVEKMLGDVKVENVSYSTSESSQSTSVSLKNEKAMSIRKVNEQPTGHFTGKIANGKPPYFSAQFERYKHSNKEEEIPEFVVDGFGSKEALQKEIDDNYNAIRMFASDILKSYPNVLPKEEEVE